MANERENIVFNKKMNNRQITRNFWLSEVACHRCWSEGNISIMNENITHRFQDFRDYINAKEQRETRIIVESGCRCPRHNKIIGGHPKSAHLSNQGWDIFSPNIDILTLVKYAIEYGFNGVGLNTSFRENSVPSVHIDFLERQSHWIKIIVPELGSKYIYLYGR